MLTIGQRIKYFRKKAGMTQQELSDISGVAKHHISYLENYHRQDPEFFTIQRLARALGVPIDALSPDSPEDLEMYKTAEEREIVAYLREQGITNLPVTKFAIQAWQNEVKPGA
jgi:transcriptional regulator with XRE-family HTH domain